MFEQILITLLTTISTFATVPQAIKHGTTQKENCSYNYGHWITKQAYWKTKIEVNFESDRQA